MEKQSGQIQIQHFQQAFIERKYSFGFCYYLELVVKSLYGIRGIDQSIDR